MTECVPLNQKKMKKIFFLSLLCVVCRGEVGAIIPSKKYVRLPQELGLVYKRLEVMTRDSLRIETWFFPAQQLPEEGAGQDGMLPYKVEDRQLRPTIIICDGDAGNMSYQQLQFAAAYTSCGFNVVTFDWRAFGRSDDFEMSPDYLCYTEMLWDYEAVIDSVVGQEEVDRDHVFLFGWSTGAYLSMITARRNPSVRGLFVIGMPSSFEEVIPHLIRIHPNGKTADNLLVPDDFPSDEMPLPIAPKFRKPILIIVGSEDNRAPQWMAEKIYNALPETTFKRLSVFPGAGHGGMESPHIKDWNRFMGETLEFLQAVVENSVTAKQ